MFVQGEADLDVDGKSTRSTHVVSTWPLMKSGLRKILRCNPIVVLIPSITISSSARRIVAIASMRVGASTISLPKRES